MSHPNDPPRSRWAYPHDNERNHIAATFHLISVILTCVALFKMTWFHVWGMPCSSQIGLYHFMRMGYFENSPGMTNVVALPGGHVITSTLLIDYHSGNEVIHCITPEVLNLMRILIMLCILSIFYSMVGFSLDVIGPSKKSLRCVRRNALPSIWTVLTIATIIGVCYLVTKSLKFAVIAVDPSAPPIYVTYEYGCYTVTAAAAISLLATACNLLQDPPPIHDPVARQRLVDDDFEGLETFSVGMRNLPPPPPYSP